MVPGGTRRHFIRSRSARTSGWASSLDGERLPRCDRRAGEAGMLLVPVDRSDRRPIRAADGSLRRDGSAAGGAGRRRLRVDRGAGRWRRACPRRGCVRRGRTAHSGPSTGGRTSAVGSRFRQAAAGNPAALDLVDRAIEGWAFTIANLVAILDPEAIALVLAASLATLSRSSPAARPGGGAEPLLRPGSS